MQPYDSWKEGDVAQAALRAIYKVMSAGHEKYGEEWRTRDAAHHLTKATVHITRAHHFGVGCIEDGRGSATGLTDWSHAMTRLAFIAALSEPKSIEDSLVVDVTEIELSE